MAYRWDTMNYKAPKTTRPQFKGDYVQDEITGEWIIHCPKWQRWLKYSIWFPWTIFFTAGTLILILWVHANCDLQLAQYLNKNADENLSTETLRSRHWEASCSRCQAHKARVFQAAVLVHCCRHAIWLHDFEKYREGRIE